MIILAHRKITNIVLVVKTNKPNNQKHILNYLEITNVNVKRTLTFTQ